jgi:hypothetical protein
LKSRQIAATRNDGGIRDGNFITFNELGEAWSSFLDHLG